MDAFGKSDDSPAYNNSRFLLDFNHLAFQCNFIQPSDQSHKYVMESQFFYYRSHNLFYSGNDEYIKY